MSTKNRENNSFLKIRNIEVVFRNSGHKFYAVKQTSLDVQKGEIFGLVGESGSGKTTIARAIVGVQPLYDGAIYMDEKLIAGKPSSLYQLNRQITRKLFDMKRKMNFTSIYLKQFIDILRSFYERDNSLSSITKKEFLKKFKLSSVEFIDDVFLSNLKHVNEIINNQERIIRFISNIHSQIPKISQELEDAILEKQEQTNEVVYEIKEVLANNYKLIHPLVKHRKKMEKDEEVDMNNVVKKLLVSIEEIVKHHKETINKVDVAVNIQKENELLTAPVTIKNKVIKEYYKKLYVFREDFIKECENQIARLSTLPNYENNPEYIKAFHHKKDFWSKGNINISCLFLILEEFKKEEINYDLLDKHSNNLFETDFELNIKLAIQNRSFDKKDLQKLEKQLKYIDKIVKRNVVKDKSAIEDYYNWKNINKEVNSEINEDELEKFIEFLELPSIDRLVKKSFLFEKITSKQKRLNRKNTQMIFQDPGSSLNDRMAVEEIIGEGLINFPKTYKNPEVVNEYLLDYNQKNPNNKISIDQVKYRDVKKYLILKALTSVGLIPEHLSRYPHEFSGGQRQRIGIARSLILKPKIIVADEPISALDVSIRAQVLNLFKKFQQELGITFIFVAHDLSVVKFIADKIAVIYRGQIVEVAAAEELFNNPLHPYTRSLLSAIPQPEPSIAKETKNIIYNPEQEHFDYVFDLPKLVEVSPGHQVFLNSRELANIKKQIQNK
ncbi:oligopeptide ABC transporter ATP-binding protein OppF [Spiroplasma tabanidicola]|uniref:Oligopeptide ABC transporter ATP-binding protein n=1 Tax=Spiroplasma tabanidicola TaxID=324079 RepID=A0A6I6C960_9MOLU|nr:oligopeptide ABC transporter ATP-binding protein OppF [Spiroplasma tabanidicola]QGS52146.1 oligopeptide ABC transporter ATP-binding protein [Spiroplasma tabanidicola]